MTFRLVHASYSLPEWQAVKLTLFAPCTQNKDEKLIIANRVLFLQLKL